MADKEIGIDIGYGYTKTCSQSTRQVFPSAVTRVVPKATFGEISPILVNEEQFLAAEQALREGSGLIDTRTTGFVKSNAWLAILGHALDINSYGTENNSADVIVLGIPPGQYTKTAAREIVEVINRTSVCCNGRRYSLENSRPKIVPQGTGMYFYHLRHAPGDLTRNVAVVDIGHYTLDMLLFAEGKYIESVTRSVPLGISRLLDEVARAFYSAHHLSISHGEAQKLLRHGSITFLQSSYTLQDLAGMVSVYAAQISSIIDSFFENLPVKPDIGLAGGGGVMILKDHVKLRYKLHILNEPVLANAVGYWYFARGSRE